MGRGHRAVKSIEEMVVVDRTIKMISIWLRIECGEVGLTEAAIVLLLYIDDGFPFVEELRQLLIAVSDQRKLFVIVVMHSEDVAEKQPRIIADEVTVAEENRLHHLIEPVLDILAV